MTTEYTRGRAEGLAQAVFGIATMMPSYPNTRAYVIQEMAGWLHVNGGCEFVLDLGAAISRERHPANGDTAVAS